MEFVLIDNASNDNSVQYVRETYGDKIRLVETGENFGYAKGYNVGLAKLEADYFILVNSDILVEPGWIEPVIELMESVESCGAAQPKILDLKEPDKFEYAGAAGGYLDRLGYPFCRGRIFDTLEGDEGQYDDSRKIFWASGACMFVKAGLFKELGGFDEEYFAHMEEIDLCWKMQNEGHSIWYCSDAYVHHLGGGTLTYGNPQKTYLNFRNSLITNVKNMQAFELWPKLLVRLLLDYVAAFKVLLSGEVGDFKAILKAHTYFYGHFGGILKKRKFSGKKRRMNKLSGYFSGAVVLSSFILRKKKFSELSKKRLP